MAKESGSQDGDDRARFALLTDMTAEEARGNTALPVGKGYPTYQLEECDDSRRLSAIAGVSRIAI